MIKSSLAVFVVLVVTYICFFGVNFPHFTSSRELEARRYEKVELDLHAIEHYLEKFLIENGRYPNVDEGLDVVLINSRTGKNIPDPWGYEYRYKLVKESETVKYLLWSEGAGMKVEGKPIAVN